MRESGAKDRNSQRRETQPPARCWSCSALVATGAKFCNRCGNKLSDNPHPTDNKASKDSTTALQRSIDEVEDCAAMPEQGRRPCPYCGERIKLAALICRFCGRELSIETGGPGRNKLYSDAMIPMMVGLAADTEFNATPLRVSGAKIFLLGVQVLLVVICISACLAGKYDTIGAMVCLEFLGAVYFLPTIFAVLSKKRNASAICLLNFLLGWTFIGWVVALVWATTHD